MLAAETAEATVPVIARLFSPSLPAAELLWFAREICKLPRRHAADLLHDHCGLDWRDVIGTVRRPTHRGGRRGEHLLGRNRRNGFAAQIPGAEVEIFKANEGGSHFMCYENPSKFNALVDAFLA